MFLVSWEVVNNMSNQSREQRKIQNSQRKLYKKKVKDNELVEIGYYQVVCSPRHKYSFIPGWRLHTTNELPDTTSSYISEVFTKESYHPGWLGEDEIGKLIDVPIFDSLKENYVNCNEVVGFTNIALDWSWYYQDFKNIDKEYY